MLKSFFPVGWEELAQKHGALKGLRQDKSPEKYLRVLLMHLGCGYSLRETAARATQAGLADLSDVALLKRLRKSKDWLHALCRALFAERQAGPVMTHAKALRLIDSTLVKEPGQTGSQWRIHYSLRWPGLNCDYFKLTATEGKGTGESLLHYPLRADEQVLADCGYCRAQDFHYAAAQGAKTLIRLNSGTIRLETETGQLFPLLSRLTALTKTGQVREWPVWLPLDNATSLPVRLCVIRKNQVGNQAGTEKAATQSRPQPSHTRAGDPALRRVRHGAHHVSNDRVFHHTGSGALPVPLAD